MYVRFLSVGPDCVNPSYVSLYVVGAEYGVGGDEPEQFGECRGSTRVPVG